MKSLLYLCALFVVLVLAAILAVRGDAHENNGTGLNLPQTLVSHADVAIVSATTTLYLPANANRVTALCYNVGTTNGARIGDASTGAAQGIPIPPSNTAGFPYVAIDNTDAIYFYSASGTTVGCLEVVRP